MDKPEVLINWEKVSGMIFLYVPEREYQIGSDEPLRSFVNNDELSNEYHFPEKVVRGGGFWISELQFRMNHYTRLLDRIQFREILNRISPEEWESYKYNFVREIRYGVYRGNQKREKDSIELNPILTLGFESAGHLSEEFGFSLPDLEEWEIACSFDKKKKFPDFDALKDIYLIENYPFSYLWEDPESTMGYRETAQIEGKKTRIKYLKDASIQSGSDLKDLFVYNYEWNRGVGDKKSFIRSLNDLGFEKTSIDLSDSPEENERLEKSDHRAFSGLSHQIFRKGLHVSTAGFRFVYYPNKKYHFFTKDDSVSEQDKKPDLSLYAYLGEPATDLLEKLGNPEYTDFFDNGSRTQVNSSHRYYFYEKGILIHSRTAFSSILRPGPSSTINAIERIELVFDKTYESGEIHRFKPYPLQVLDEWNASLEHFPELEKKFRDLGIRAYANFKEDKLSSIHLEIDRDHPNLYLDFQIQQGIKHPIQLDIKSVNTNRENHSEIIGIVSFEEDGLFLKIPAFGEVSEFHFESSRSTFQYTLENRYFHFTAYREDKKRKLVLLGDSDGSLFLLNPSLRTIECVLNLKEKTKIDRIQFYRENLCFVSNHDSFIYCVDFSKKEILHRFPKGEFVLRSHQFFVSEEKKILMDSSNWTVYDSESFEKIREGEPEDYGYQNPIEFFDSGNGNEVFLLTDKNLLSLNLDSFQLNWTIPRKSKSYHSDKVGILYTSPYLWISGNCEIEKIECKKDGKVDFQSQNEWYTALEIHGEKILGGTWYGQVALMDGEKYKKFQIWGNQKGLIYSLLYQNRRIFIGDSEGTVHVLNPKTLNLIQFYQITHSVISGILLWNKKLILSSWSGSVYIQRRENVDEFDSLKITDDWIVHLSKLDSKNILLGTKTGNLFLMKVESGEVKQLISKSDPENSYLKVSFCADKKKRIWVGTGREIKVYSSSGDLLHSLKVEENVETLK
ncbi:MAG: hypothetical protein KDK54_21860, partial [Leptospiraceae bacterium]|nr:hypothetical protein [Leptospiraceae bacterium]